MRTAAIVLALLVATPAQAEFYDGNMLLQRMNGDAIDQMAALGYVAGVWDAHMGVMICPPPNVMLNQVRDMTKALLVGHPEYRHQGADRFVIAAGAQTFPCPKSAPASPKIF